MSEGREGVRVPELSRCRSLSIGRVRVQEALQPMSTCSKRTWKCSNPTLGKNPSGANLPAEASWHRTTFIPKRVISIPHERLGRKRLHLSPSLIYKIVIYNPIVVVCSGCCAECHVSYVRRFGNKPAVTTGERLCRGVRTW